METVSVRVQMKWIDDPTQDVLIDVHLNSAGLIVGGWSIFGRLKEADDNGTIREYPFSLSREGVIFFGPNDVKYSTNARERSISIGELCTIWGDEARGADGGSEWTYRFSSVATLGAGT